MSVLIVLGGLAVLLFVAVLVGMSMDTERQRAAARATAARRRALWEERQAGPDDHSRTCHRVT